MVKTKTAKIGVVLSSGGGRGIFGHTGFLLALKEMNMPINAMAGCSAGAVVGSVCASGGDIYEWAEAINKITTRDFWLPKSKWALLYRLLVKKGAGLTGIAGSKEAINFVKRFQPVNTFEECQFPFSVVALNLGNGEKVIFRTGELGPRVIASAAMPVFYEPLMIDDNYYSDGATVDLAPSDAICCRHSLDIVLIHHVANRNFTIDELKRSFNKPYAIGSILYRLIYRQKPWYETGEPLTYRTCPCGCKATIIVIEPVLAELDWPLTRGGPHIMASAKTQATQSFESICDNTEFNLIGSIREERNATNLS